MNTDGSGLIRLTDDTISGQFPVFSPDGSKIIFEGKGRDGSDSEIFMVNTDGSGLVINLTNSAFYDMLPFWSPVE